MLEPEEDKEPEGEYVELNGRCDCGSFLDHGYVQPKTGSMIAFCDAGCELLIQNFKIGK